MFVVSKKKSKKIIHRHECGHAQRIKAANRLYYYNIEEAFLERYTLCRHCMELPKQYEKQLQQIKDYCQSKQLLCKLDGCCLHIEDGRDKWLLFYQSQAQGIRLYHRNYCVVSNPVKSVISGYHLQNVKLNSILNALKYIEKHFQSGMHFGIKKVNRMQEAQPDNVVAIRNKSKVTRAKERKIKKRYLKRDAVNRVNALLNYLHKSQEG